MLASSSLLSDEALHLTRILYSYSAVAFLATAILFGFEVPLLSSTLLLLFSALVACRVFLFVRSTPHPHVDVSVVFSTISFFLMGSVLCALAALRAQRQKNQAPSKLKQQ